MPQNSAARYVLTAVVTASRASKTKSISGDRCAPARALSYRSFQFKSFPTFLRLLNRLDKHGHCYIVTGQPSNGFVKGRVVVKNKLSHAKQASTIARCKDCLSHLPDSPVIVVIDFDRIDELDNRFNGRGLIYALRQLEALHKVPMIGAYSGSCGLRLVSHAPEEQAVNRVYFPMMLRAGDSVVEVVKVINRLLILYGSGAAKVHSDGRIEVSAIDTRINRPWQPEYLTQARAGAGWTADPRSPRFLDIPQDAVEYADSADFWPLKATERSSYEAVCRELAQKPGTVEAAALAAQQHKARRIAQEKAKHPGINDSEAAARAASLTLALDDVLPIGAGGANVTVEDMLDNPEHYHRVSFDHSALDPAYTKGATVLANLQGRWPHLYTFRNNQEIGFEGYEKPLGAVQ